MKNGRAVKCTAKTKLGKVCKKRSTKAKVCWVHAVPITEKTEGTDDALMDESDPLEGTEEFSEEGTEEFEGTDETEELDSETSEESEGTDETEELDSETSEESEGTDETEELDSETSEESEGTEELDDSETSEESEGTDETDELDDSETSEESEGSECDLTREESDGSEDDDLLEQTEAEIYATEVVPTEQEVYATSVEAEIEVVPTERSSISPEFYQTVMALLLDIQATPGSVTSKLENYGFVYTDATRPVLCDGFYYTYVPETGFTLFEILAGLPALKLNLEVLSAANGIFSVNHFFRADTLYVLLQACRPAVIAFGHALTTAEERKTYDTFHESFPRYLSGSGNFQFQPAEAILFNGTGFTEEMCDQFLTDIDYSLNVVAYE
jgi:hypothetical protein